MSGHNIFNENTRNGTSRRKIHQMIRHMDSGNGAISYQLFWSMIQLVSRNQRAVSPEAQPRVIQPSDCEI